MAEKGKEGCEIEMPMMQAEHKPGGDEETKKEEEA